MKATMKKIGDKKTFYRCFCRECRIPVHLESSIIKCPFFSEETAIFYQCMYINGRWSSLNDYRNQGGITLIHNMEMPDTCRPEALPRAA